MLAVVADSGNQVEMPERFLEILEILEEDFLVLQYEVACWGQILHHSVLAPL